MACRFSELVVDSRDPEPLAALCAAVLDNRVLGDEHGTVEIGPAWLCPPGRGVGRRPTMTQ